MRCFLKRWLYLALVLAMMLSAVGCGNTAGTADNANSQTGGSEKNAETPKSSFEGQTIRFVAANHMWTDAIKPLIPQFEEATGMKVSLESYAEDQLTQKLTVELTSGNSTIDAFMTRPLQEAKLFMKNKWYESLDGYVNNAERTPADWDIKDFMASTMECSTVDGTLIAIPIMNEYHILYYRTDLFEQAGLKPPTTFEELEECAKKLNNPSAQVYGIVSRGQMGAAVTQLSSYLFGFGGDFIKDGKCVIDSPEAIQAFQYYGRLLKNYGPPGVINMSWPQCVAIFQAGQAAMYADGTSMMANFTDPSKSKVADKFGLAMFPAGPAGSHAWMVSTWGLAIPANSENKDAAWEFIKWATNKQNMKAAQLKDVSQTRNSVWADSEVTSKLFPGYQDISKQTAEVGTPYDRPLMISVVQARDIMGEVIVKSIESGGTTDIASLTKSAAEKVNVLLKEAGEGGE